MNQKSHRNAYFALIALTCGCNWVFLYFGAFVNSYDTDHQSCDVDHPSMWWPFSVIISKSYVVQK